eukprot:16402856-Heterocapsa_arctica.AAC.1
MSLPADWDARGAAFAPLPAVGTLLRLGEVMVGERTGITLPESRGRCGGTCSILRALSRHRGPPRRSAPTP